MNNSVFGKTIEKSEKRVDFRIVTSKEKALKLAAKPTYERYTIFDENKYSWNPHEKKRSSTINQCILELHLSI